MAIPSSGKVSIGDIRAELQNTGATAFSLQKAGRPTTGVPGTFGNPIYTPLNQSSSFKPDNDSPFSISEWGGYNHTQNAFCDNKNMYIVTGFGGNYGNGIGVLYSYSPLLNTLTILVDAWTEGLIDDYAITERGIIILTPDYLVYYSVSWSPFEFLKTEEILNDGFWSYSSGVYVTSGLFATAVDKVIYWYYLDNINVSERYSIVELVMSYDPVANVLGSSADTTNLFHVDGSTYQVYGGLFYLNNKYYLPYSTGGSTFPNPPIGPHFVGRFTSVGDNYATPERSVPVDEPIDGIFYYEGNFYGVAPGENDNRVYLLDFVGQTSSYQNQMPLLLFGAIGQINYSNANGFTSSALGPYYSYYRVGLEGQISDQSLITVTGDGTYGHYCYIYTEYPFNNIGQLTGTAWTYSRFDSNSVKYFSRDMSSNNEVLHFVMFEDMN